MKTAKTKPASVGEYIRQYPAPVRKKLNEVRKAVKQEAPDAKETIKYGIPAYV